MYLHVGFDNLIMVDNIVAIVNVPGNVPPAPVRRDVYAAQDRGQFIDLTCGRSKASILYLKDGYIAASAVSAEALQNRLDRQVSLHA